MWAKLLWAGLNLTDADLPGTTTGGTYYPIELVRAVTLTWLFAGLRSDEIARLRVGCDPLAARRAHRSRATPATSSPTTPSACSTSRCTRPAPRSPSRSTRCSGRPSTPGRRVRPAQPARPDRKTGEHVDLLFCHPRPAGREVPTSTARSSRRSAARPASRAADVRGNITSHRARSTIASQLYNAKEPMTLFELQAWLGHRTPNTTQHYAKITPNTLTKAYTDAGYFARNVRTIEVLLDRDAVTSGAAADGQPWQHYDLGHGYCTYTFFEQCPHRMACARCDFYTPKASTKAQLLEAKDNLQRMLASIPLTDDERAAVDDGHAALDALLDRLTDIPTPAGPTPTRDRPPSLRHSAPDHRRQPAQTRVNRTNQIPHNGEVADVAAGLLGAAEDALDVHLRPEPDGVRRRGQVLAGLVEGRQRRRRCRGRRTPWRGRPTPAPARPGSGSRRGAATTPGGRWRRRWPAARCGGCCRGWRRGSAGRRGVAVRRCRSTAPPSPTQRRVFCQNRSTTFGKWIASRAARR